MSNDTTSSIRSALSTIVSTATTVQEVHTGRTLDINGFPAVCIWLASIRINQEELESDNSHQRTYIYNVEVMKDTEAEDHELAEELFQDCLEEILDIIQANPDLYSGGTNADIALASDVNTILEDSSTGIQISAIIPVEVTTHT